MANLNKNISIFKILFLSLVIFFINIRCSLLLDEIQFKVLATGAGFTGYYIVDGNDVKFFEDDNNVSGGFTYGHNTGELKYLEINVLNKAGATSLKIKVYRNSVLVKEGILDAITGTKNLNLTYRFKEEESAPTTKP